MPRKGSAEYKEARKRARREAFVSRSIYPKLVEAQRTQQEYYKGRRRGESVNRAYAEYNQAFDAGVARRMDEEKPKRARKPASSGKTAHVPAGNANGGQFTGRSNPPSGGIKPKNKQWQTKLTPVGTTDEALLDPYGPPNPRALRDIYGSKQLPAALGRYSAAELRGAASIVGVGTSGSKATLIRRIVTKMESGHISTPKAEKPKRARKAVAEPKAKAPRKPKKGGYEEWAAERDRLRLALRKDDANNNERVLAQMFGHQSEHPRYAARYIREHPELYGYREPEKPKRRKSSTTVPRQGRRVRRNTQERAAVYSEARRGLRNRRARGA